MSCEKRVRIVVVLPCCVLILGGVVQCPSGLRSMYNWSGP
jgi:hypothetical protein